jgi:thiol-disulfide isomerase/thioredoxin
MRCLNLLSLLVITFCGCAEEPPKATPKADAKVTPPMEAPAGLSEPVLDSPPAETLTAEPTAEASKSDLKIEILDWEQTQAIVTANPGKVIVMDLWATYCPPCLKELPGLVALQEKHPEVICVSVCLDFDGDPKIPPSQIEPEIREVLLGKKAQRVRNVLLSTSSEDLFKKIEHQSMPVIYVFDQAGQRVATFPDLKNPEESTYAKDVTPVVEKLLAAPKL